MTKQPAVYILASKRNGTLYVGVTSDLRKRAWTHKNDLIEGFTRKYGVHLLVYYELYEEMVSAITREKQIKKWNRAWKLSSLRNKIRIGRICGMESSENLRPKALDSRVRGNDITGELLTTYPSILTVFEQ